MHKRVHHGVEVDDEEDEEERYAPILGGASAGGEGSLTAGVAGWSGGGVEEETVNSGGVAVPTLDDLDVTVERDLQSRRAHRRQASTHQEAPSFLYSILPIRLVKVQHLQAFSLLEI
jgi:hypothetical protein